MNETVDATGTVLKGYAADAYNSAHTICPQCGKPFIADSGYTFCSDCLEPPEEPTCGCGPKETCPICKDAKIAAGISPKYDAGKLQYSLMPPIALKALAEVLSFGAKRYAPNSWQNVEEGERRYLDALYRHLESYRSGEAIDSDSGLSHLAHAITNLAFLLHFEQKRINETE